MDSDLDTRLARVAALAEPVRRALYRYVATQPQGVSRDDAAQTLGIAHHTVKFHLDRLVAEGVLAAEYRRPPGRGGPGAGRPTKLYRAVGDIDVSLPERRYDLAGRLLVRAVADAQESGRPVADSLVEVAHAEGADLARRSAPAPEPTGRLEAVLSNCGFAPCRNDDDVTLANCPFHALAQEDRALVCGMNLAFVRGLLDGAAIDGAQAVLDPADDRCCVRIVTV